MTAFLQTYRLALTPLSPIHIGCGEDFEPTNYVIEDDVLYGFEPSRAVLSDHLRSKLMDLGNKASLLGIQRFFSDNAAVFKAQATTLIPVSDGIARKYAKDIGKTVNIEANGNQIFNQFIIERASYTGANKLPYIPGSSLKGALRTAWIDALNNGAPIPGETKSSQGLETSLLKGDFECSPLRQIKIADLMPTQEPRRRVVFGVNRKKKQVIKDGQEVQPRGVTARKECITPGQYRTFWADAVIPSLETNKASPDSIRKLTPHPDMRLSSLKVLGKRSNAYHLPRLIEELKTLEERYFVDPSWANAIRGLVNGELAPKLQTGDVFLVRLGRYGGANSKTLSGKGVAKIRIMQGKGQPAAILDTTKTVWLAADQETQMKGMLPFGWALIEIDPSEDLQELKRWCQQQGQSHPDLKPLREALESERSAAVQRKAQLQAEAKARALAQEQEAKAADERAKALAAMSPQQQIIATLKQECLDLAERIKSGNFKKQAPDIGRAGLYQEATKIVKAALESTAWTDLERAELADTLEKLLPEVISPWDAKEQRKKLKFALLRGQS